MKKNGQTVQVNKQLVEKLHNLKGKICTVGVISSENSTLPSESFSQLCEIIELQQNLLEGANLQLNNTFPLQTIYLRLTVFILSCYVAHVFIRYFGLFFAKNAAISIIS